MRYLSLTDADRKAMREAIGCATTEELFASVPQEVRTTTPPDLPSAMTEARLQRTFNDLARKNVAVPSQGWLSFLGGGCYDHYLPAVVDALASRGEFATAYTPYQAELSQGTLQAIFEFQSMVANLFSLDLANASMYDGASSLAEAILMALRAKKGRKVYLSQGIHPEYLAVIRSYVADTGADLIEMKLDQDGCTVLPSPEPDTAAMVIQQPNFFGVIEDVQKASSTVHGVKGLAIVGTTEAMAFGLLKGPGAQGADVVAGEGQSFGNSVSFGGPHVGLLATRKEFMRQLPGRLVGKAFDQEGRPGYVLTLATREQHIRRERATSNICTNHSLCALRACIHMAALGERGVQQVASRNRWGAETLRKGLLDVRGVEMVFSGSTFNEFGLRLPKPAQMFLQGMEKEKILGGIPLAKWFPERTDEILITVTETKSEDEIKAYLRVAKKVLES